MALFIAVQSRLALKVNVPMLLVSRHLNLRWVKFFEASLISLRPSLIFRNHSELFRSAEHSVQKFCIVFQKKTLSKIAFKNCP